MHYKKLQLPSQFLILAFLIFPVFVFSSCTTKYYIVRHAEKLNNTDTSSLSPEGKIRADALRDFLINKNISKIYASIYKRTQQTAKPLSNTIGKQPVIYSPDTTESLADHLKKFSGSSILIIGHTNNIPELVELLSDDSVSPIPEDDFDNLYIIEINKNISWTSKYLTSTVYGALSP